MLKVGLIVNPVAGMGGPVALKGTDKVVEEAKHRGAQPSSGKRAEIFLKHISDSARAAILFFTGAGEMGEHCLIHAGFSPKTPYSVNLPSSSEDTIQLASKLANQVDILVFVGGDGTARDICQAVSDKVVCLGVPAGVKMYSGVFAVNPQSAAEILNGMASGALTLKTERLVKDIDEVAFRAGKVVAKTYGSLWVPETFHYLQQNKEGGKENEGLAQIEIAADIRERMQPEHLYFIGPGSTTFALKQSLGIDASLLGVDVVRDGKLLIKDATVDDLQHAYREHDTFAILTVIGGQGHLFGRGNQQFSAEIIRKLGIDHLWVVATQTKITALQQRPLRLDTGDAKLDQALSGIIAITVGYQQKVLVALSD